MNDNTVVPGNKRSIWLRALFMLLMGLAFHVCITVLGVVTIIQFVVVLVNDAPNARLISFGRSMGKYLGQIADFETFATEDVPFPFSEWPAGE